VVSWPTQAAAVRTARWSGRFLLLLVAPMPSAAPRARLLRFARLWQGEKSERRRRREAANWSTLVPTWNGDTLLHTRKWSRLLHTRMASRLLHTRMASRLLHTRMASRLLRALPTRPPLSPEDRSRPLPALPPLVLFVELC
jgi:hypothetical protein